jgi:hypothetical protein
VRDGVVRDGKIGMGRGHSLGRVVQPEPLHDNSTTELSWEAAAVDVGVGCGDPYVDIG